jgi:hypothetical protein
MLPWPCRLDQSKKELSKKLSEKRLEISSLERGCTYITNTGKHKTTSHNT